VSRRRLLGSLCALVFVTNLARLIFAALLEPLSRAFGVETAALGLLATLVWFGSALLRLPTGWVLTKVSREAVIVAAGLALTVATVLASLAPTLGALQAAAFLIGLTSGAYFIAANPLVSELFPDRVGLAIGIHGTAAQLGAVSTGVTVIAVLAVGTWQTAFQLLAVCLLGMTVVFAVLARRADLPAAGGEDRDLFGAIRAQWRIVLAATVMLGLTAFVWQGVFNFYVTFLKSKDFAEPTAQTLLSVTFAAGVPAFLISGRLTDALPTLTYILTLLGGFVGLLLVFTVVEGFVAVALVSVALGYVIHSLFPAADTYLLGSLPDHHRASAYAAYSASMMFIQAGGSWVVGVLDTTYDLASVFQWFAVGLFCILIVLAVGHARGRLPAGARVEG